MCLKCWKACGGSAVRNKKAKRSMKIVFLQTLMLKYITADFAINAWCFRFYSSQLPALVR